MIDNDKQSEGESRPLTPDEYIEAQLMRAALLGECEILLAENEEIAKRIDADLKGSDLQDAPSED